MTNRGIWEATGPLPVTDKTRRPVGELNRRGNRFATSYQQNAVANQETACNNGPWPIEKYAEQPIRFLANKETTCENGPWPTGEYVGQPILFPLPTKRGGQWGNRLRKRRVANRGMCGATDPLPGSDKTRRSVGNPLAKTARGQ